MARNFDAFREAMKKAAADCGVVLEMGSITYGNETFSFSSKCYNAGDILSAKREEFNRYCGNKGIPSNWYMRRFIDDGNTYEIYAIAPRGRKNVLKIRNVATGKEYVCSKGYVRPFIKQGAQLTQEGGILISQLKRPISLVVEPHAFNMKRTDRNRHRSPNNNEEIIMNVQDFVKDEKNRLDTFVAHWVKQHAKDYPEDMSEQEWINQYFSWLEPL